MTFDVVLYDTGYHFENFELKFWSNQIIIVIFLLYHAYTRTTSCTPALSLVAALLADRWTLLLPLYALYCYRYFQYKQ